MTAHLRTRTSRRTQSAVAENSNAIALGLLGDEWNLTIVKLAIMSGVSRYKDFRDTLGIANSVLTVRLRRLTEAGVFTMRQYSDAPRAVRVRAHRARPRPVAGAADHLVVGGHLGHRAHRAAAADVPPGLRRGILPGHALPGLRPAGRPPRRARDVRAERRLRPVGAAGHHPAPVHGWLARPGPGVADDRADRQPLVGLGPGRRVPRRPAVHRHADHDGRAAVHRVRPAAYLLPDGRAGDPADQRQLRPGRVPADRQGPRLLPARHGDAELGRQVVPRARGAGHAAHPHQLRRRRSRPCCTARPATWSCTARRSRSAAIRPTGLPHPSAPRLLASPHPSAPRLLAPPHPSAPRLLAPPHPSAPRLLAPPHPWPSRSCNCSSCRVPSACGGSPGRRGGHGKKPLVRLM